MILIKTFHLKTTYILTFIITAILLTAGFNTVMAEINDAPATSWAIAHRTIVVDPGHGGIDPGAVGCNGIKEKDIALQVGKQLKNLLTHAGAKVIMTRETDTDLSTPGSGSLLKRKREDLNKRVSLANTNEASAYLSIHVNAFPSSRWRGAQTFFQRQEPESKKLAEAIQSELIKTMGNTTRAAKGEDFYTTRNTKMAGVIIEIGFISNPAEAKLLIDPQYQRKLAHAIYNGLVKYYTQSANDTGNKLNPIGNEQAEKQ